LYFRGNALEYLNREILPFLVSRGCKEKRDERQESCPDHPRPHRHPRETPINEAWRRLAASGAASRYGGRAPDGRHEVLLTQPVSGRLLATGRGDSVAQAICAALAAVRADA